MSRSFDVPSSPASPLSAASLEPESVASGEAVLTRVDSVIEAELLRGRLESAGVPARLTDTHTAGLGSHLTAVIGGIRVIVAKDDLDTAREILDAPGFADDPADTLAATDDDAVDAARGLGRADIAARWALWSALLSVLVPIGAHIGSLVMLWRAIDIEEPLSPRGRR